MPRHMGQMHIGIVPLPAVPVAAANTRGVHPDDDCIGARSRIGEGSHLDGATELFEVSSKH